MHSKNLLLATVLLVFTNAASGEDLKIDTGTDFSHAILETGRVTSSFGVRQDPFRRVPNWHSGVDLGAGWDEPIYAPGDGKVVFAGKKSGYGNVVELAFETDWVLRFSSLKDISVEQDDLVTGGTVLGHMGTTAPRSTGPHLHLEVIKGRKQIDPSAILGLEFFAKPAPKSG